ncbi:MAG: two-component system response regulator [Alphaproteobacteria bacterium MedPE-SWcel]|nr:MAG: two-component system response regulator [Alphaproteobacteria bacterium MedPE-SWcel]
MSDGCLLIVDDDPEIASALARGLALHGYETVTENRADLARAHLRNHRFSGAIVDVMLGNDNGLDLVREARSNGVTLPILVLSALADVEHRAKGLEAGADDYVVKPFSFDELVARLRVQERRAPVARPDPAVLCDKTRSLHHAQGEIILTEREYELLSLLAEDPDIPHSRSMIFDALWAKEGAGNENVVDVYIGYLRKKLAPFNFGFEIKTVRHKGFCLDGLAPRHSPLALRN